MPLDDVDLDYFDSGQDTFESSAGDALSNSSAGGENALRTPQGGHCSCVDGQQCRSCKLRRGREYTAKCRTKMKEEREMFLRERDEALTRNRMLEGELTGMRWSVEKLLRDRPQQCPRCGHAVSGQSSVSPTRAEDAKVAGSMTKLAECRSLLSTTKVPKDVQQKQTTKRRACAKCSDDSCDACAKKKGSRTNCTNHRQRKTNLLIQYRSSLQWTVDELTRRNEEVLTLRWQVEEITKQLRFGQCSRCGWTSNRIAENTMGSNGVVSQPATGEYRFSESIPGSSLQPTRVHRFSQPPQSSMGPAPNFPSPRLDEIEPAAGHEVHIAREDPRFVPCEPGGCYHLYHTLVTYRQPMEQPPAPQRFQSTVIADVPIHVRIGYIFSDFNPSAISKQIRETNQLLPQIKMPRTVCPETTIKAEPEDFIESDDPYDSDATVRYRTKEKYVAAAAEEGDRNEERIVQPAVTGDVPDDYIDVDEENQTANLVAAQELRSVLKDDQNNSDCRGKPGSNEAEDGPCPKRAMKPSCEKQPHIFEVHSYRRPTECHYCSELMLGLVRQGIQCKNCKYDCHLQCAQFVKNDCPRKGGRVTAAGELVETLSKVSLSAGRYV